VFENPVGAGRGGGETGEDAVTGTFDAGEVDINFGYNAGHIYAFEIFVRISILSA
jgi:hypothetical protein